MFLINQKIYVCHLATCGLKNSNAMEIEMQT